MGLVIYDDTKNQLSEVAFVRDTLKQDKIRDVSSYELIKQIGILFAKINAHSGIKSPIPDIYKADIKEMIMLRFKNLSINEIEYAFKLERYGSLGEKTEHYQDFNASYVAAVLDKYKSWKQKMKLEHNISHQKKAVTATEREKAYWINRGVTECIDYFEANQSIMDGKLYIYDVLYDEGKLPSNPDYKRKMYQQAKEVIEFELSSKKASSKQEKKSIKQTLSEIQRPKCGKVINKAKELVLLEFFRKLFCDPDKVTELRKEFKNSQ